VIANRIILFVLFCSTFRATGAGWICSANGIRRESASTMSRWATVQALAQALGVDCRPFEDNTGKSAKKKKG
jgi:hypothetical protein